MYNTPETHVESDENNLLPSTRSDFQTLDSSNSDIIKHLNKYEYACNVYHRLKQFLEGIDICIAGLCLGILGAGHLWVEFMNISSNSKPDYFEKIPPPKSSQSLYYCFYGFVLLHLVVATSLLFILLLRTCFIRWEVIYKEFLSPMCIVYYSCIQMCLVISSSMTLKFAFGEKLVFAFGSVMCALQVPLMLFFFYICYKNKEFPSPIWNPPTLNIALTTLFAVHQHQLAPKWMASWSFGSSILLLLLLVPPQIFRVIAYPNEVIPSTGVSMLQAPCSIVAMVWGEFRRSDLDMPSWLGGGNKYTQDKITHFLCISATGVFWITVYRRRSIWHRGISPELSALTFPMCSTATFTIQYLGLQKNDFATPKLFQSNIETKPPIWLSLLRVYAFLFGLFVCILVIIVSLCYVQRSLWRREPKDTVKKSTVELYINNPNILMSNDLHGVAVVE